MRKFIVLLCAILSVAIPTAAQDTGTLVQRIKQITTRPVFKHSAFGVEVYDLTTDQVLVAINREMLFTSGSTTKLVTEGTALALLGENYRFHTRVYYTGSITDGTLDGDLVLVASGDPNLSARVMMDDTLEFTSSDHAYAGVLSGKSVPGDPLRVFKELASGVLMKGIWRIRGNVVVDATLFPSNQVEPGTHATISPVMLNDNIIDVIATSAPSPGGPVTIEVAPALTYLKVVNKVRTNNPDTDAELRFTSDITETDGSHTVVLEGSVPAGREKAQAAYKVKDPVQFATAAFCESLRWAHIVLEAPPNGTAAASIPQSYAKKNLLVEHVSPPFKEEVKVTLKASQNLHAATTPYLLGAILAHGSTNAFQKGIGLERQFLTSAGLNPESVSQLDGEGGIGSAFSPDFMVRYLAFMSRQPYGKIFFDALPVLGRDGTLEGTMKDSPAAGHVHAKTGSYVVSNALDNGVFLLGKGLVGYVDAANGHKLIFAAYVNLVPLRNKDDVSDVGEMLSEIAVAAYQYSPAAKNSKPRARTPLTKNIH